MFPAELQRIRENILGSFGLDAEGKARTTGYEEGDAEKSSEERALIQAALQDLTYRRYAGFFSAVENGDGPTVQAFIVRGMDVNSTTCDGLSALHLASLRDRPKIVNILLDHGAAINAADKCVPVSHVGPWDKILDARCGGKADGRCAAVGGATRHCGTQSPRRATWWSPP
jgi:hypothetical protein